MKNENRHVTWICICNAHTAFAANIGQLHISPGKIVSIFSLSEKQAAQIVLDTFYTTEKDFCNFSILIPE